MTEQDVKTTICIFCLQLAAECFCPDDEQYLTDYYDGDEVYDGEPFTSGYYNYDVSYGFAPMNDVL